MCFFYYIFNLLNLFYILQIQIKNDKSNINYIFYVINSYIIILLNFKHTQNFLTQIYVIYILKYINFLIIIKIVININILI